MKLTNLQMDQYLAIMGSLQEKGKLGYAIAKNIHKMSDAAKEYLELKQKLIEEYGKPGPGGRKIINETSNPEGFEAYKKEMGDIPQIETDVDIFQVDEETFCSGELTSAQMASLFWMIKGEK